MKRVNHLAVLTVLLALTTAACAREGGGRAQRLTVVATDFAFEGVGDKIQGGTIELNFSNEGEAQHEFAIIRAPGKSVDEFTKEFAPVIEGGAFPDFMQDDPAGAALFEIDPGESRSTTFTLPTGEYFLFCALSDEPGGEGEDQPEGEPHYERGMIQQVAVEDGDDRDLEAAGGSFVARDYTFDVSDQLAAGKQDFVFRNDGPDQWHHMILNEFPEGTSEQDAIAAFETFAQLEEGQAPPEGTPESEEAGSTGVLSPGMGQTVELELKAGRTYVAACFIQDVEGGPPHAFAHKMVEAFTVEG